MQFYVIGDESTVTGFGLAGVEGEVVETVDEAREALGKAFAMDSTRTDIAWMPNSPNAARSSSR